MFLVIRWSKNTQKQPRLSPGSSEQVFCATNQSGRWRTYIGVHWCMRELVEFRQSPCVIRPELLDSLLPTALTCQASICIFRAKGSPTPAKKVKLRWS